MTRRLTLGIGCRRGVTSEEIEHAVRHALGALPFAQVRQVATLSSKCAEPGLLAFCDRHALPLVGIDGERIAALEHPDVTASLAAQTALGVIGVSEPCALLAATQGRLLVARTAVGRVTVAVAEDTLDRLSTDQDTP